MNDPTARAQRASARRNRPKVRPEGFAPFRDAPDSVKRHFRGKLERAHSRPMDAIYLFCVECNGYSLEWAKKCALTACPLYALNRRLFDA